MNIGQYLCNVFTITSSLTSMTVSSKQISSIDMINLSNFEATDKRGNITEQTLLESNKQRVERVSNLPSQSQTASINDPGAPTDRSNELNNLIPSATQSLISLPSGIPTVKPPLKSSTKPTFPSFTYPSLLPIKHVNIKLSNSTDYDLTTNPVFFPECKDVPNKKVNKIRNKTCLWFATRPLEYIENRCRIKKVRSNCYKTCTGCTSSFNQISYPSSRPYSIPSHGSTKSPSLWKGDNPSDIPSSKPSLMPTLGPLHIPASLQSILPSTSLSNNPLSTSLTIPSFMMSDDRRSFVPSSVELSNSIDYDLTTNPVFFPECKDVPNKKVNKIRNKTCLWFATRPLEYIENRCRIKKVRSNCYKTCTGCTSSFSIEQSFIPSYYPSLLANVFPSMPPTLIPPSSLSTSPSQVSSELPNLLLDEESISPNMRPKVKVTKKPTTQPNGLPNERPSDMLQNNSSVSSTMIPSVRPTGQPSSSPSMTHTIEPTYHPTLLPSSIASTMSSQRPTVMPTISSTIVPYVTPTSTPSIFPSISPTVVPSEQITLVPKILSLSLTPAEEFSDYPTVSIFQNTRPTVVPSKQPTLITNSLSLAIDHTTTFSDHTTGTNHHDQQKQFI